MSIESAGEFDSLHTQRQMLQQRQRNQRNASILSALRSRMADPGRPKIKLRRPNTDDEEASDPRARLGQAISEYEQMAESDDASDLYA